MLKIKEAIVTEGKYDKIRIRSVVDCTIIETNGFRIFGDIKKINLIRKLAYSNGIIVLTDSDAAGFLIRNYIKTIVSNGIIKHAYIPNIIGKEKRKSLPSKEGKLGVEGMSDETILESIKLASTEIIKKSQSDMITKQDFYKHGLSGKKNSKIKRSILLDHLNLPGYISTNELINILNCIWNYSEFSEKITSII